MKKPWFDGRTGHDGYCLARLTFAEAARLCAYPLGEHLADYEEVTGPRDEWMRGDRFFLAAGVLERVRQGGGWVSSQLSVDGPVLEICHNIDACVDGLSETRLLLHLAGELELLSWHFEVGCREVQIWAQGQDGASLIRHLRKQ